MPSRCDQRVDAPVATRAADCLWMHVLQDARDLPNGEARVGAAEYGLARGSQGRTAERRSAHPP